MLGAIFDLQSHILLVFYYESKQQCQSHLIKSTDISIIYCLKIWIPKLPLICNI